VGVKVTVEPIPLMETMVTAEMADGKVRVDPGQGWLMITLNGTVGPGVSCKGVATTCRTNPFVKPILVMSVKET